MMHYGYAGKIAEIDLTTGQVQIKEIDEVLKKNMVGGRGFIAHWLYDMVPFDADPLGEQNVLIFADGALCGTLAPSSARVAVGALAPETGIWSIGNAGGYFAVQLKRAGYDAIILKGKATQPVYLSMRNTNIQILPAEHLWGLDVYQTDAAIKQELGDRQVCIATIGPSGERGVLVSTIMVDRVRAGGRGGLGAVMGSKNLKAVAVRGNGSIPIYDPKDFYQKSLDVINRSAKLYFKGRWEKGSYSALRRYSTVGALSTRNAQLTSFDEIEEIAAETYLARYKQKNMRGCFACSIPCWSYFYIQDGPYGGFYDENVNATTFKEVGARCGLGKMDAILYAASLCNRYGLDTIAAPAAISFAMECFQRELITEEDTGGLILMWGNDQAIVELLEKMAHNEGFGAQLAQGVRRCAQQWGGETEKYALHVKGMETVGTDPRGQPSWGLGYATSSRGACHMRAYGNYEYGGMSDEDMLRIAGTTTIKERFSYDGKGRAGAYLENLRSIGDAIGMCHLLTRGELGFQEVLAPLYEAATGVEMSPEDLYRVGERIYNVERLANLRFGLTPADDTLPERYLKEPVPEGPAKGKVLPLEPMLREYYQARDWDWETGYPSKAKIEELDLAKYLP